MDKIRNVPEIRFNNFSEEWEWITLGELGDVKSCKRIYKNQTSINGEIPFYKIGTFGGKPDAFIDEETYEYYKNHYSYPEIGDILISASGTLGRTVEYQGQRAYYQDSNIVWLSVKNDKLTNNYLSAFYSFTNWDKVEGSTIKRLYNKDILSKIIPLPPSEEQLAISKVFKNLDEKLEIEKAKHQKLINFKKAMLEDMFPKEGESKPKIRFDGFDGEWNKYTLGSNPWISKFAKGNGLSKEQIVKGGKVNPAILYGHIFTEYGNVLDDVKFSLISKPDKIILSNGGDLIIPASSTTSDNSIVKGLAVNASGIAYGGDINILRFNNSQSNIFFAYYLENTNLKQKIFKCVQGTTIHHLYIKDMVDVDILLPTIEEQAQIGSFFKELDEKIDISANRIKKVENFKKSMMDKMFV